MNDGVLECGDASPLWYFLCSQKQKYQSGDASPHSKAAFDLGACLSPRS
jgi:hypothetical protein